MVKYWSNLKKSENWKKKKPLKFEILEEVHDILL